MSTPQDGKARAGMEIVHGLISSDSHAQPAHDAFTKRMSKRRWGDAIPHLVETADKAHMVTPYDVPVQRWCVNGKIVGLRGVVNCPTAMDDPTRKTYPQRWEDVPPAVYDPERRLEALDLDGLDGEVLFPNDPVGSATFFQGDAEFELDCVRAYNDWLAEWREVSPRFAPLALIPYMSDIETTVAEVTRAVNLGHRGIVMLVEPSQSRPGLHHFNDPYWNPLWEACEALETMVHWHGGGGLNLSMPVWSGFSPNQQQAIGPVGGFTNQAQFIPNLIFSGVLDRYPRLKWVCAETGLGWVNYVLDACDHEWERRHLWTEGVHSRPSELFKRQIYVDFWYEAVGIEVRHSIGIENIMWESDYPHSTSTFPDSRDFVARTLEGVPDDERRALTYGNALRLYRF